MTIIYALALVLLVSDQQTVPPPAPAPGSAAMYYVEGSITYLEVRFVAPATKQ